MLVRWVLRCVAKFSQFHAENMLQVISEKILQRNLLDLHVCNVLM